MKIIAALLVAFLAACSGSKVDDSRIPLTEEELAFVVNHPEVTFALEENRPPYIFIEDGEAKGLSIEYLKLISKKTGLKFIPIKTATFTQTVQLVKDGKIEVMTAVRPTPETANYFGFTPPFAYQGGVFIFRVNTLPRSPLTAGILKGSSAKSYITDRFPDMNLVEADDDEQSLGLLQKGLLDGSLMDAGSAAYLSKKATVKVRMAQINFDYPYSLAYRQKNTTLGSILTKAISSISAEEKQKINAKWLLEEQ